MMRADGSKVFYIWTLSLFFLTACQEKSEDLPLSNAAQISKVIQLDKGETPVEYFFSNPEKSGFDISPDGRFISFLSPYESRMNIHIQRTGSNDTLRLTSETDRDISYYFWKNSNTLIYLNDNQGDENYQIYSVDTNGKGKELATFSNVRVNIINQLPNQPDEIMISMNKNNPALFEPYRLNIVNGSLLQLAENSDLKNPVTNWMADNDGKLRVAVSVEKGTQTHLLYRPDEKTAFRSILTNDWKDMVAPLFFDADNHHIIALSNLGRDKTALVRLDPDRPEEEELLFSHESVDVWFAEQSPKSKSLGAIYYVTDRKYTLYPDSAMNRVAEKLALQLPGREIYLNAMDDSLDRFIVRTYSDVSPGHYFLYEADGDKLIHLAAINPKLDNMEMAKMRPISYQTKDKLTIHGYITLPVKGPERNLPVVVLVHGGPMSRDIWGFKPDVQLLANRGYAVLQVNYRGSWGYGKEFSAAGFREWGKKMQDDISEGVAWLVEQDIADPEKVAIYGASYGGYAALAGLTFTPDLYRCGISYVGPSNLFTLLENLPAYWEPEKEMMYEMIGHPQKDSVLLHDASPVFFAANIKAPLFIAQGANDVRVTKIESEQMVDALRAKGVNVLYMLKENEGHGFRLEENRLEFYKALCGFLEENMPVSDKRRKP